MKFDMGQAWDQALALTKANFQLLAILAGVFLFLPAAIMAIVAPDSMAALSQPSFDEDAAQKMLASLTPSFYVSYIVTLVASMVGYIAMLVIMSDRSRPTVGQAIGTGFKALPTLIATTIIFMIGLAILVVVFSLIIGMIVGLLAQASPALGGILGFIVGVAGLVGFGFIFARLSLTMPVLVNESNYNPLTIMTRSWSLTKQSPGRLLLFFVLLFIAYFIVTVLIMGFVGLIAAATGAYAVAGIVQGLVGALVAIVMAALLTAIYRQFAGDSPETLTDTFE